MPFALLNELATERDGHDVWYRFWTQIGPCCTSDPKERALFADRDTALLSNALTHSLSFYEIVELPEGAEGDWDWNKETTQCQSM